MEQRKDNLVQDKKRIQAMAMWSHRKRAAVLIQEYAIQAMVKIGLTVLANTDVLSRNMAGAGKCAR